MKKQSKFDFEYMSNDEGSCVAFNKQKWTKEKALEQAKIELDSGDSPLVIFSSFVRYGFWRSVDGEVYNNWYINDIFEPVIIEVKNKVAVWVVREVEK